MSSFIEGVINKNLCASLYTKKHTHLSASIKDAIDLDENCDIYQEETLESGAFSQRNRIVANDVVPRIEISPSNMMPSTQELANKVF